MTFIEIEKKIKQSAYLDFGNVLDQTLKLFKEVWLKGFLMIAVILVLGFGITLLFTNIGLGSRSYLLDWESGINLYSAFTLNSLYSLPQTILLSSIMIGALAGFYRNCRQADLNQIQNEDMFYFFKSKYISKLLSLGMIYAILAAAAQALFLLPYIYVFVPLSFFSVIFAFNEDLSEAEIVKLSFILGTKKWFLTFGLLFIMGVIACLGLVACGVGVFFTMSIVYIPVYFVYRDVVGFSDDDDIMKIGTE
ncbi:MAG: hypothetical protein KC469_01410 [Flavobacteriaceae bacterium]|nr:hypothetical protein [Flavobacteriaceae bacterium]